MWEQVRVTKEALRFQAYVTVAYSKKKTEGMWTMDDVNSELIWDWSVWHGNPSRDKGRYRRPFGEQKWSEWPGMEVPLEEVPSSHANFMTEPQPNGVPQKQQAYSTTNIRYARVRRMDLHEPRMGIIIGNTCKIEGSPSVARGGYDDYDSGYLGFPLRRIPLLEVALESGGKADITLCYEKDLEYV